MYICICIFGLELRVIKIDEGGLRIFIVSKFKKKLLLLTLPFRGSQMHPKSGGIFCLALLDHLKSL